MINSPDDFPWPEYSRAKKPRLFFFEKLREKERDKERDFKFRKDFEEALNKESYQTLFNYVDGLGLDD